MQSCVQNVQKHMKGCKSNNKPKLVRLQSRKENETTSPSANIRERFLEKVVSKMEKDEVGLYARKDPLILVLGQMTYDSRKPNKEKEAKIKSRSYMRRLSRLVLCTQNAESAKDLFVTRNFEHLEESIRQICKTDQETPLGGLATAIGALLKDCAKKLIGHYHILGQGQMAAEMEAFKAVLNNRWQMNFGWAEYQLTEKRKKETRKPSSLPDEDDLEKLRCFVNDEISNIEEITNQNDYVQLRMLTIAKLTILNARRGSEPSKITCDDFHDRHSWLSSQVKFSDEIKEMMKKYSLTYIMGKGIGLVPILLPRDCEKACGLLADPKNRELAGVSEKNRYLFPYTCHSDDPVTGYNELKAICDKAGIKTISATQIRHRAATLFWSMEGVSQDAVNAFVEHMGHSEAIDRNIYAAPPALKEMGYVAPIVSSLNKRITSVPSVSTDPMPSTSRATEEVTPSVSPDPLSASMSTSMKQVTPVPPVVDDLPLSTSTSRSLKTSNTEQLGATDMNDALERPGGEEASVKLSKKGKRRIKWTSEETKTIITTFKKYVTGHHGYAGKKEILDFQKKIPAFQGYDWKDIRTKVFNENKKVFNHLQK